MRHPRQKTLALVLLLSLVGLAAFPTSASAHRRVGRSAVVFVRPVWSPGPYWHGPWWWRAPYAPSYTIVQAPSDAALVELDVQPKKAEVRVDGQLVGQVRDYNDPAEALWLRPGEHVIEISYPGYQTLRTKLDTEEGYRFKLRYDLDRA